MMPYPALLPASGKRNTRSDFNNLFPEILTLAAFLITESSSIKVIMSSGINGHPLFCITLLDLKGLLSGKVNL